jgi:hypothetical protein
VLFEVAHGSFDVVVGSLAEKNHQFDMVYVVKIDDVPLLVLEKSYDLGSHILSYLELG